MTTLDVEVWSDVACPWCWVGKRNLEAAIAELGAEVEVTWHSFELDPSAAPSEALPADYVARIAVKYGVSRAQAEATLERIVRAGAEAGVAMRFDRIKPGNTFDAHRLLHFASLQGLQNDLKERLFRAYLEEGAAISDRQVLAQSAEDVGLAREPVERVLSSDQFAEAVRDDETRARQLGVSGVPFFVVGGRYALSGAQPPSVLREALERCIAEVAAETATRTPSSAVER